LLSDNAIRDHFTIQFNLFVVCKMTIREANQKDIPEIVSLLKISLGESLLPKSEIFWRWKHIENPFGKSPVLIAVDDGRIIGVRAFMRWQWQSNGEKIEAVRAVDTATHPQYQGKGVFKTLTLKLLEQANADGLHLVFNTPNQKSKPGYLKMGWEEAGRLPVNVRIINPFNVVRRLVAPPVIDEDSKQSDSETKHFLNHPLLHHLLEENFKLHTDRIFTSHTTATLQWRYQVPGMMYHAAGIDHLGLTGLMFYRIKQSRLGRELRINDIFIDSPARCKEMKKIVEERMKLHRVDYLSLSNFAIANVIGSGLTFKKLKIGPIVTIKNIRSKHLERFKKFNEWSPSLGDLELF
jgi:N-acetylglutamate synthase-like GNAT family acetyltransferase